MPPGRPSSGASVPLRRCLSCTWLWLLLPLASTRGGYSTGQEGQHLELQSQAHSRVLATRTQLLVIDPKECQRCSQVTIYAVQYISCMGEGCGAQHICCGTSIVSHRTNGVKDRYNMLSRLKLLSVLPEEPAASPRALLRQDTASCVLLAVGSGQTLPSAPRQAGQVQREQQGPCCRTCVPGGACPMSWDFGVTGMRQGSQQEAEPTAWSRSMPASTRNISSASQ